MTRTRKKSLAGRAVLAAGALVASVLVAGVAPAAAVTDRADHATRLSACVGDAAADRMFTDVSAGHVFRAAINCVAYYGITRGTGDGSTYSPEQVVTRAQMAVFIARAAEVAGVDLGSAGDAGFDDIDDAWAEAQAAINRLALKGIIPSGGAFRPGDAITRAEMATFLIGLLVEAAPDVTRDSSGAILLGVAGSRSVADDRFPDAVGAEIAAIYELGVTRGASAADVQDDTEPPLDFNYEPDSTVDRGQMAAFITRALAHTPVRPAGVTAQYDGADIVVSVRNAQYRPVSRAAVDVFWAATGQADRAFSADGTCNVGVVAQADRSSFLCEIDGTAPVTGRDGDATVAVAGLRRVPEGGAAVWVWTGRDGDTVADGVELFMFDVAEDADLGFAEMTLISTFTATKARFGRTVLYTMQLHDIVGKVSTGVNGIDPARWSLSTRVGGQDPETKTLVSDETGAATFSITIDDPDPGTDDDDVIVEYTLVAADNAPSVTIDTNGQPVEASARVIFSDDAPSIDDVRFDTPGYVYVTDRGAANTATVTVLDQYGDPFTDAKVSLKVSLESSLPGVFFVDGEEFKVNSRGSAAIPYQYSGEGGATGTLTATVGSLMEETTVYWAADAGPSSDGETLTVRAGDVRRRHIVVDDGDGPVLLVYDDNDRFDRRGVPTSMAAFEAELAIALRRTEPGVTLEWSNYRAGSDGRVTEYDLT